VLTRWQGVSGAIAVTLATFALVALDLSDTGFRRWWDGHALTTDTLAGLLVVLVTVQVVDQVVKARQITDRSRAVAAQTAIVVNQAIRTTHAVTEVLDGKGDRDTATEELRTYMMMLLVSAPVLIDARASRSFLEEAQRLAGEIARVLTTAAQEPAAGKGSGRLNEALDRLQAAAKPLLEPLNLEELARAGTGESK
jgi:hypothetical protein